MQGWEARVKGQDFWGSGDADLFVKFAKDAQARQIGERRIEKYRTDLTIAHSMTGMGMREMVKDVARLAKACVKINNDTQYQFESKHDAKRTLGSLFCFVHYKNRSLQSAPLNVREIVRHRAKGGDRRLARATLTREEVRDLCKHAGSTMDKALLWLLFESGMRNGEFEQLKKSDVVEIDEGLLVKVPAGKTGEREVIVVEAAEYVKKWLSEHPVKDPDAALWHYVRTGSGGALAQAAISKRLRNIVDKLNDARKKEGIPEFKKDVNPHNFRHSRATELGGEAGMTEQILCKYFGWEIGSKMPRTYLHLTNEQVRRAVLRTYGKAKPEDETKVITHWTCPRCKKETPLGDNYCSRCSASREGKVLSQSAKLQAENDVLKKSVAELEDRLEDMERRFSRWEQANWSEVK